MSNLMKTLQAIDETYREAKKPNWNGEDAEAVTWGTLDKAKQFVNLLSEEELEGVSVGPCVHGDISFDWSRTMSWTFSVSIDESGVFTYAGLFDGHTVRGTDSFSGESVSPIIQTLISRARTGSDEAMLSRISANTVHTAVDMMVNTTT